MKSCYGPQLKGLDGRNTVKVDVFTQYLFLRKVIDARKYGVSEKI